MSVACVSLMCVCVRLCRHWISTLTTQTTYYQEESKRMSVWCVSLMAVLGRLAQETQGDNNTEEMLKNAAGALRKVKDLVEKRAKSMSSGVLGQVKRTHSTV